MNGPTALFALGVVMAIGGFIWSRVGFHSSQAPLVFGLIIGGMIVAVVARKWGEREGGRSRSND